MTESVREAALRALFGALAAHAPPGAVVLRNATVPERVPAVGLLILRDGEPGEPEVTLSPATWHYVHRAEVDVICDGAPAQREPAFDAAVRAVGLACAADRTLGGAVDWAEPEAPAATLVAVEGAEGLKAATVVVRLHYATADPVG